MRSGTRKRKIISKGSRKDWLKSILRGSRLTGPELAFLIDEKYHSLGAFVTRKFNWTIFSKVVKLFELDEIIALKECDELKTGARYILKRDGVPLDIVLMYYSMSKEQKELAFAAMKTILEMTIESPTQGIDP